ncbi:MAG: hypothetical protein V5A37_06495 [Halobacteriales archaeon]
MSREGADTMAERAGASTAAVWFVFEANRWLVAGVFGAGLWLAVVAVGVAHPTPAAELLAAGDPVDTLFQALIAATVTVVTLVLTLSQLILTQELGAVGDQRNRMEGSMDFRADVADAVGIVVSPAEPSAFLRALVDAAAERANAVRAALDDPADEALDAYLSSVTENAAAASERLAGAEFGTFGVLRPALDFNYSWKLYAGRRLLAEQGETLPPAARDALEDLVEVLELFGPAREHVKTLYFQWELSNLSRVLLLSAIPALTVAITALVFFDPATTTGATLGLDHALLVLATAVTLTLVPFALMLAYILRIVTVTKRTLAIGPLILRETERDRAPGEE